MKITVLKSSPHKNGASNIIADEFIRGIRDAGNTAEIFDAAHMKIKMCIGCDYCRVENTCCHKDDMQKIKTALMASDMLVLVTPLYYFGMSSQLKLVIDRFYGFDEELKKKRLKSFLITAGASGEEKDFRALRDHYRAIADYLCFQNVGEMLCASCPTGAAAQKSEYPLFVYKLGKQIK